MHDLGRRRGQIGLGRQAAGLEEAVADQHGLQVAHDRAGRAHQHLLVDHAPIRVRADDVLRPEERGSAVDDDDLPMIAQVESRGVRSPQTERHHGDHFGAHGAQPRTEPLEAGARADGVGEHAHSDAAPGCALQRGRDVAPGVVVLEDVEEQMHIALRGVDIGNDSLERGVVVGQQLETIAADKRKFGQPVRET